MALLVDRIAAALENGLNSLVQAAKAAGMASVHGAPVIVNVICSSCINKLNFAV